MNKQEENLQIIREAIEAAVGHVWQGERYTGLVDILIALKGKRRTWTYGYDSERVLQAVASWNLHTDSLGQQSEACIENIASLLTPIE